MEYDEREHRDDDDNDMSNSTDSYSTDEEYLKIISGYEEDRVPKLSTRSSMMSANDRLLVSSGSKRFLQSQPNMIFQQSADGSKSEWNGEDLAVRVSRIEETVNEQSQKLDTIIAILEALQTNK